MDLVFEGATLVEFMYLVFTHMPGDSHCRWNLCTLYLRACQVTVTAGGIYVPCIYAHARWQSLQVEFMYLVFTRMPGDSHCRWLRSLLLCLCDIFRALRELSMCVDIPRNISFLHAWLASPPAVWLLNSDHFSVLLCRKMSKQSTTKHDPMKKQHQ